MKARGTGTDWAGGMNIYMGKVLFNILNTQMIQAILTKTDHL